MLALKSVWEAPHQGALSSYAKGETIQKGEDSGVGCPCPLIFELWLTFHVLCGKIIVGPHIATFRDSYLEHTQRTSYSCLWNYT